MSALTTRSALVLVAAAGLAGAGLADRGETAGGTERTARGFRHGLPAAQTEVTGTWNAVVDLGTGSGEVVFVLQQTGESLTGTYRGAFGSAGIIGTVRGRRIEFAFQAEEAEATYTGRITQGPAGMTMDGSCDYGDIGAGTWSAKKVR